MNDDLPIINFSSNQKRIDRSTLSRIRSHAQQKVQDGKWQRRSGKEVAASASQAIPKPPERQYLKLVFEKRTRKSPEGSRKANAKKDEVQRALVLREECRPLAVSPVDKRDPFSAFPVEVNAEVIDLMEGYYLSWKWGDGKATMFQETMSSPALCHSFLTMAYHIWRGDEVKTMLHENKTMELIANGITQLGSLSEAERPDADCRLMWAIIRLATLKANQGRLDASLNHLNALVIVSPRLESFEYSRFGPHLKMATASLILANFTQSGKVSPLLQSPFGSVQTSAVADVKSHGFMVPNRAVFADPNVSTLLDPIIVDCLLALTALYNTSDEANRSMETSLPHTHAGQQASQAVKIALRLAQLTPDHPADDAIGEHWLHELQDVVRLTAVLFTWSFARKVVSQHEAVFSVQNQLRVLLSSSLLNNVLFGSHGNSAVSDLLLWVLIVCGSTTNVRKNELYYAELIRSYFPNSRQWTFERAKSVGEKLPWIDIVGESPVEEFWALVTADVLPAIDEQSSPSNDCLGPLMLGYKRLGTPKQSPSQTRQRLEEHQRSATSNASS